jgi:hypothetical protein
MRRLSAAALKLALVLLTVGATLLMTGQKAHAAVSCNTKECAPNDAACQANCKSLPAGQQAACHSTCLAIYMECLDACE